jgi:hypothetical protein
MTAYNRNTLLVGLLAAVAIGGAVSYFASARPDGLEKTQEDLGAAEPVREPVAPPPSVFEEYSLTWLGEGFWGDAAAGVFGALLVLVVVLAVARLVRGARRDRRDRP